MSADVRFIAWKGYVFDAPTTIHVGVGAPEVDPEDIKDGPEMRPSLVITTPKIRVG